MPVFRGLGINIAMMSDFHGDGHPKDPGPIRFREQKDYFEGCRRFSDRTFLIMPGEEPARKPGRALHVRVPQARLLEPRAEIRPAFHRSRIPKYGKVYHTGSAADQLQLLKDEQGLMWQAHPRTKGSSGYPDAVRDWEHFKSDRFLGALLPIAAGRSIRVANLREALLRRAGRYEQLGRPEIHDRRG